MNLETRWKRYWFTPEAPQNLGACRIAFYAMMLWLYGAVPLGDWGDLSPASSFWKPLWPFQVLHLPVAHAGLLTCMSAIWKISLITACIGLFTRASTIVAFGLGAYFLALQSSYLRAESAPMMLTPALAVMAFSYCGDACSLDALFRARRGKAPAPASGEYRWPVRAMWVMLSIVFFAAGFAKLHHSGVRWATGNGFAILLMQRFYDPHPPLVNWGLFVATHPILAKLSAAGALFTETCFPLVLFSRRARQIFPPMGFGMQCGIGLLMSVWFVHFFPIYVFFIPWGDVLAHFRRARAASIPAFTFSSRLDVSAAPL
ncbi:MAG: putative rane protein [Phycisphaerales bacterium]|nr:putative rane protein [Phycisphaerales bacterium]